jgi:hypothetical protein
VFEDHMNTLHLQHMPSRAGVNAEDYSR